MKIFDDIKAMEITENEMNGAAGGDIVYNNGYYEVIKNEAFLCKFTTYDEAVKCAKSENAGTRYFGSKREYANFINPVKPEQTITYLPGYSYYIDENGVVYQWIY